MSKVRTLSVEDVEDVERYNEIEENNNKEIEERYDGVAIE